MTIYELRNIMKVDYYNRHANGGTIRYYRDNHVYVLQLTNDELLKELIAIGSLEDTLHDERQFSTYVLSQWDALNIAIRYQLSRDAEFEIDNADIGKAIENLKNK